MIEQLLQKRLILVTGKGGVGKSTLSAALALVAARRGRRVVICEVEGPSAVAPLLGAEAGTHSPKELQPGIELAVLRAEDGLRAYLGDKIRLQGIVDLVFKQPVVSRFFRAAPAFSEMGILYAISRLLEQTDRKGRPLYDHVIVDLPASGHAVGMLEAPFVGREIFTSGPVRALCEAMGTMLTDSGLAACAIVTLPEELPVNEALELQRKLADRGLHVEAVVANAVEPPLFAPAEVDIFGQLRDELARPLIAVATQAAERGMRHSALLRRLEAGLRSPPLPLAFRLDRGQALVQAIAAEMEGGPHEKQPSGAPVSE